MRAPRIIEHKRGDTFEAIVVLALNSVPQNLTGWTIQSQIRGTNSFVATLNFNAINLSTGTFSLTAAASTTATWPVGTHSMDIQITDSSGFVISTETIVFRVLQDVTGAT
jgi:hypothetical protein